jgi:hypothetical protein
MFGNTCMVIWEIMTPSVSLLNEQNSIYYMASLTDEETWASDIDEIMVCLINNNAYKWIVENRCSPNWLTVINYIGHSVSAH